MLNELKQQSNLTRTENGAAAFRSTESHCLDLFASAGAMRCRSDEDLQKEFIRAYTEDRDLAMKILFFARDIRSGLGERRFFRTIFTGLARTNPASVEKNIPYVAEYGRYDDLLPLLDTPCRKAVLQQIKEDLRKDLAALEKDEPVSLLGKWLPSINTSSRQTVQYARIVRNALGMTDAQYRKTCTKLRKKIEILENYLRETDYTFDYSKQPSKALLKYRDAFLRNDNDRYCDYLEKVSRGNAKMNTGTLYPYEIIAPICRYQQRMCLPEKQALALDTTWKALPDYTCGENALCIVDGSGSMYGSYVTGISPSSVALSLGIYFAERNTGHFKNHFVTFSETPRLVEIKGKDITEKVNYCKTFDECANTNLQAVFKLLLRTAVQNKLPQEELPSTLYIISDMEFDYCTENPDETLYRNAKKLYEKYGYTLPKVVFWNVCSRHSSQPVTMHESGTVLVSGASPRIFEMVTSGCTDPYDFMMTTLNSPRYEKISA